MPLRWEPIIAAVTLTVLLSFNLVWSAVDAAVSPCADLGFTLAYTLNGTTTTRRASSPCRSTCR